MSAHLVFLSLLWIAIAVGVAIHANNRGRSGFLWFVVTFFLGVFGVVIYLLVSWGGGAVEVEDARVCPNCSTAHAGTPNFCSDCGEPLEADDETGVARIVRSGSQAYCGHCQSRVAMDAATCPDCGRAFSLEPAAESNVAHIIRSGSRAYCGDCKSRVSLDADSCAGCGAVF